MTDYQFAADMPLDRAFAESLDARDDLASFRDRFVIADPDLIYLDGNSLGRLPIATRERIRHVVDHEWGDRLIRSWNEGWFETPNRIGGKLAQLVGAQPDEVIMADATSVNLFKLVVAALEAQPDRRVIVTDDLNFPSDLYILQGVIRLLNRGHELRVVPSPDGIHGPVEALIEAIDNDTALVALSHTVFKSGYTYDMERSDGHCPPGRGADAVGSEPCGGGSARPAQRGQRRSGGRLHLQVLERWARRAGLPVCTPRPAKPPAQPHFRLDRAGVTL